MCDPAFAACPFARCAHSRQTARQPRWCRSIPARRVDLVRCGGPLLTTLPRSPLHVAEGVPGHQDPRDHSGDEPQQNGTNHRCPPELFATSHPLDAGRRRGSAASCAVWALIRAPAPLTAPTPSLATTPTAMRPATICVIVTMRATSVTGAMSPNP